MLFVASAIFIIANSIYFWTLSKKLGMGKFRSFAAETYNNFAKQDAIMPTIDEIGNYTKIITEEYIHRMLFMDKKVYILNAQYETNEYIKQKELLDTKYTYQTELIVQDNIEYPEIFPGFITSGYVFRTLSLDYYNLSYPKQLYFIGRSDATREIIYIAFSDGDLDYISKQLNDFLKRECDWKYFNKIKKEQLTTAKNVK